MIINEIFYSIQGEGRWTGFPNIFIRTTGCNLRCSYCDTTYAYTKGTAMILDEIIHAISTYPCKRICITGGEPLQQRETIQLLSTLLTKTYRICLETNGSYTITKIPEHNHLVISLDIKCPGSHMHKKMRLENISYLKEKDQLKFVIKNKKDYTYAKQLVKKYTPNCPVFFQPVWGTKLDRVAKWILQDNLDVQLSTQFHKLLWTTRKHI